MSPDSPRPAAHYTGRFAPSPTGALHAGSMVAALASWLDARAWPGPGPGRWLVRIEDLDTARCVAGAAATILRQLHDCALVPDAPPLVQSTQTDRYALALRQLREAGYAYACGCSRRDIAVAAARADLLRPRHAQRVYPGTCRDGLHGKPARSWRFRIEAPAGAGTLHWVDRRLGAQRQDVALEVGDFILQRADGPYAYQLAVCVDDAWQGVTHVVRGADLADNTARQILLQRALVLPTPVYLHTPLVLGADGQKLSKQNGAQPVDTTHPLQVLHAAAAALGLPVQGGSVSDALTAWVAAWRDLYNPAP